MEIRWVGWVEYEDIVCEYSMEIQNGILSSMSHKKLANKMFLLHTYFHTNRTFILAVFISKVFLIVCKTNVKNAKILDINHTVKKTIHQISFQRSNIFVA